MRRRAYLSCEGSGRFGLVLWFADIRRMEQVNQRANRPVFASRKWLAAVALPSTASASLPTSAVASVKPTARANRDQVRAAAPECR